MKLEDVKIDMLVNTPQGLLGNVLEIDHIEKLVKVRKDIFDCRWYAASELSQYCRKNYTINDSDMVNNVVKIKIGDATPLTITDDYKSLFSVLLRAWSQAATGKGKERHANGESFEKQQICQIQRWQESIDFATGQAIKKCLEVTKLSTKDAKVRELLGAINYIAAAIIVLEEQNVEN